jgi:hypothetical protein
VQNLKKTMTTGSACEIVACSGEIVCVGRYGIEHARSSVREHHVEENLLLQSRRARREVTVYDHPTRKKKKEDIQRVELEVDFTLLNIEPCLGGRYPGHRCRDFSPSQAGFPGPVQQIIPTSWGYWAALSLHQTERLR